MDDEIYPAVGVLKHIQRTIIRIDCCGEEMWSIFFFCERRLVKKAGCQNEWEEL